MDILDIVNSYIKNKQESNPIPLDIDSIIMKLNNNESLEKIITEQNVSKEIVLEKLLESGYMFNKVLQKWLKEYKDFSIDQLLEITCTMFNEKVDTKTISLKYLIPEQVIIKELEKKKFRNRWTFMGKSEPSILSDKMKFILYQLNTLQKDIKEIAQKESLLITDIEQEFKNKNYKKIWMLEKFTRPPYGVTSINNQKIIYDINTGEPIAVIDNGRKLFTMKQIENTLSINPLLIYNKFYQEFSYNIHYVKSNEYLVESLEIFKGLPHLKYLSKEILFTEKGLQLFATLTNTTSLSDKKLQDLDKILEFERQNSDQFQSTNNQTMVNNNVIQKEKDVVFEIEKNSNIEHKDLNIDAIIKKLNINQGLGNIAKEYGFQLTQLNKILRDGGYRFDSFFNIWTSKNQEILIEEAIRELNSGTTLYDYAYQFFKEKNQRLHFADRLRRKIELLGYQFDQKSKKWLIKNSFSIGERNAGVEENKKLSNEMNIKETNLTYQDNLSISIDDIIKRLRNGGTLKSIEEETGIKSQELRIQLKSEGYKYDGFFQTWINEDRNLLLHKLAADIIRNRKTIDDIEKSFSLTKGQLENQLKTLGYQFNRNNIEVEDKVGSESNENKEIKKDNNGATTIGRSLLDLDISDEDIKILKAMIEEKKNDMEATNNKHCLKIYLSTEIFEQLEEYSEKNNITKSNLIEKALDHYMKYWK